MTELQKDQLDLAITTLRNEFENNILSFTSCDKLSKYDKVLVVTISIITLKTRKYLDFSFFIDNVGNLFVITDNFERRYFDSIKDMIKD